MKQDDLVLFTLALSAIGFYGTFLSPVSELATTEQTPGEKQVLRESAWIGTAHLLVVAGIAAIAAKNHVPLTMAVLLAVSVLLTYEYAMARTPD